MKHIQSSTHDGFSWTIVLVCLLIAAFAVSATVVALKRNPLTTIAEPKPASPAVDTSGWKSYTDPSGFSLKYPPEVLLNSKTQSTTQLMLSVSADKLSDIPEDLPMLQGRNDVIAQKDNLAKAQGPDVIKIGALNGKASETLAQFEECSVIFSRTLTFFPGDYRVRIMLTGPKEMMKTSMPDYFSVNTSCPETAWNQNKMSAFIPTLAAHQGKGIAQQWYDTFDGIIKTVTLVRP